MKSKCIIIVRYPCIEHYRKMGVVEHLMVLFGFQGPDPVTSSAGHELHHHSLHYNKYKFTVSRVI